MAHQISSKIKRVSRQRKVEVVYSKDILHQKFIEAGLELDASIVEPFIPEDMILQDLDKYRFLENLQGHFDSIWQKHPEDYRVELADFICIGCQGGEPLASFEVFDGINLAPYEKFAYYVQTDDNGKTVDIFCCFLFGKNRR